jgi:hypothetical protein
MGMDGLPYLARRIADLDGTLGYPHLATDADPDLVRCIVVMEQVTSTGPIRDTHRMPLVTASEADALVGGCRLLARLKAAAPEIVTGPLRLDTQYWIATGKPSHVPPGDRTLSESSFITAANRATAGPSTKPFGLGLFTATGGFAIHGMWRLYLDLNWGSTLSPLPWHTWAVQPRREIRIREITTAADWVDFVRSYPIQDGQLLYPDWSAAARDWDAVHMTLRAITASQGLYFPAERGIVAAPYWDIESTLWLRWCFNSVHLVEVTG